ncbi:MAG: S8 family serine peptidase [Planctomycetota bacterium]
MDTVPETYLPNEIIIKIKGVNKNHIDHKSSGSWSYNSSDRLPPEIETLNKKHGAKEVRRLFKDFSSNRKKLQELRSKSRSLQTKKEKRIIRRLKRAPKGFNVPDLNGFYKIAFNQDKMMPIQDILEDYKQCQAIEHVELNYIVSYHYEPNDSYYKHQWSLRNIGQNYPVSKRFKNPPGLVDADIDAPEAWDRLVGSSEIIVAVIDTGVDIHHRDLAGKIWVNNTEYSGIAGVDDDLNGFIDDVYGYDFFNKDSEPIDDNGHGTHCAGIIAANSDNGLDIAGTSPSAKIMAVKFLNDDGGGMVADAAEAIYYAVENGADILSNSWGSFFSLSLVEEACKYAYSQGVVVVAAAGNEYSDWPRYPAYYPEVISVAATDSDDQKAPFTTFGDWVDLSAPGVDILSLRAEKTSLGTVYNEFLTVLSGTSMSCPYVSGVCSLLFSVDSNASVEKIRQVLKGSTDPIAPGISDAGRLNANRALLWMQGPKGSVDLDAEAYSCSSIINIQLFDTNVELSGPMWVNIFTAGGDSELVQVIHNDSLPGIFDGVIETSSEPLIVDDDILQTLHGQTITVTYEDVNDGTGQASTVIDTAIADCQAPNIFVSQTSPIGPNPSLTFETDEPSVIQMLYSSECESPTSTIKSSRYTAYLHRLTLKSVQPWSEYFYIIEAVDLYGNHSIEDNSGSCYTFTTDGPRTIHVPDEYSTIQQAINLSWEGGNVLVADGVYTGKGNTDITFRGKAIKLHSAAGPAGCIIDCNGTKQDPHRGFRFSSRENVDSVLSGFTITNGYALHGGSYTDRSGGAILCKESDPTITNCIIINNSADWNAGAINNFRSNPRIEDCILINNIAIKNDGGAINNDSSSPFISNCIINNNTAYDWGGAIRNVYNCQPTIIGCLIAGNTASGTGGAIFAWENSDMNILNSTIAQNSAGIGSGIATDSSDSSISTIHLGNCILSNGGDEILNSNSSQITASYSNIEGGYEGIQNITSDPCFVSLGYFDDNNDWMPGNYHLLYDSKCIDTGDPNYLQEPNETDLDGSPRIEYGRIDIGAYEFQDPVSTTMKIIPKKLNLKAKGPKKIKVLFTLPAGITHDHVVQQPFLLCSADLDHCIESTDYALRKEKGAYQYQIAFSKDDLVDVITSTGTIDITIYCWLDTSQYIYAADSINIK